MLASIALRVSWRLREAVQDRRHHCRRLLYRSTGEGHFPSLQHHSLLLRHDLSYGYEEAGAGATTLSLAALASWALVVGFAGLRSLRGRASHEITTPFNPQLLFCSETVILLDMNDTSSLSRPDAAISFIAGLDTTHLRAPAASKG